LKTVTIHAAKTTLSKLIAEAEAGEEIIIARGDKPVAKIVPFTLGQKPRVFGSLKGIISLDDFFFDPLPEDELKAWE